VEEIWADVLGFEGLYKISNYGRVKSLIQWNGHKYLKRKEPLILKCSNTSTGYKKVELVKDKIKKSYRVHRLVAIAFIPNLENKECINYKDFDPFNNNVTNLEWVTQIENIKYSEENHKLGSIKNAKIKLNIIDDSKFLTINELVHKYKIPYHTIRRLLKKNNIKSIKKTKYNIEKEKFKELLKTNMKNIEIAKILNCSRHLVNVRRYQMNRGKW